MTSNFCLQIITKYIAAIQKIFVNIISSRNFVFEAALYRLVGLLIFFFQYVASACSILPYLATTYFQVHCFFVLLKHLLLELHLRANAYFQFPSDFLQPLQIALRQLLCYKYSIVYQKLSCHFQ